MIPWKVIRIQVSLQVPHLRIFPMTGSARFAGSANQNSSLWNSFLKTFRREHSSASGFPICELTVIFRYPPHGRQNNPGCFQTLLRGKQNGHQRLFSDPASGSPKMDINVCFQAPAAGSPKMDINVCFQAPASVSPAENPRTFQPFQY